MIYVIVDRTAVADALSGKRDAPVFRVIENEGGVSMAFGVDILGPSRLIFAGRAMQRVGGASAWLETDAPVVLRQSKEANVMPDGDEIEYKYKGKTGEYIPGVPAHDLTKTQAKAIQETFGIDLSQSELYQKVAAAAPEKEEAPEKEGSK